MTFHATVLKLYPEMFPGPLRVSLAAHALSIGATVVAINEAEFADAPGLVIENWTC